MSDTKTTIGALFRRMRKLSRLNMAEAAGALDLSITTLSDIENDKYAKPAIPREPTPAQLAAVNTEVARQTGIAKDWLRYATEVAHALGRCHCSDSGCYPGNLSVALERVKELTDAEEELSQLKAQLTAKPAIPMVDHYSTAPALPTEEELVSAVESGAGCSPGSPTCADIARAVLDLLVGKGVQAERTSEVRRETCPVHGAGKGGNG